MPTHNVSLVAGATAAGSLLLFASGTAPPVVFEFVVQIPRCGFTDSSLVGPTGTMRPGPTGADVGGLGSSNQAGVDDANLRFIVYCKLKSGDLSLSRLVFSLVPGLGLFLYF